MLWLLDLLKPEFAVQLAALKEMMAGTPGPACLELQKKRDALDIFQPPARFKKPSGFFRRVRPKADLSTSLNVARVQGPSLDGPWST